MSTEIQLVFINLEQKFTPKDCGIELFMVNIFVSIFASDYNAVWILNTKDEVIIQKRCESKESWPGLWDISCAGHISHPDNSVTTAKRELEEELGLKLPEEKFELTFQTKIESITNNGIHFSFNQSHDFSRFIYQ
jgi:8-oxo-dGTP pyrophosphatase MutT (NUDIX family)